MKTTEYKRLHKSRTVGFILLLSLLINLVGTARPALASCGGVTNVSNETQLNNRIADFNSQGGPCHYTIVLLSDINLTASTTTIDNPTENVDLLINGSGFSVNGQNIAGVRPFEIAVNTEVTMQNITITGGNVAISGGGIRNSGILILSNSDITSNTAGQEGGGLWNSAVGTMIIQNGTSIEDNTANIANSGADAQGDGGVFNNGGMVHISDAVISNNTVGGTAGSDDGGGGLFNDGRYTSGTITLIKTTIMTNTAMTGIGSGGAILNIGVNKSPAVNISGGMIRRNEAIRGGGIETNLGTVNLSGVSLISNTATFNGGGLHITGGGTATIEKSTIGDNSAGNEGGWTVAG